MEIAVSEVQSIRTKTAAGTVHAKVNSWSAPARPAVILVHGLVVSSSSMLPTLRYLATDCRVYAPDLPGYGRSYRPGRSLNLTELADALAEWMEALNLSRACLAGNSFGCQVIAEFAVRHPEQATSLVLQGPTVDPRARSFRQQAARLLVNSAREQRSMGRVMISDYWAAGARRVYDTIKLALADKIEEKLPRISARSLVVRGERDPVVPQEWAETVAALLPHGKLEVIPRAAHAINYSMPQEFAAAIKRFVGLP